MKFAASWQLAALLCFLIAACTDTSKNAAVSEARIIAAHPAEWLAHGRTYDEQRYSPLGQINRGSVEALGLAWWAEVDTDRGQEATPLVANGVIYTTTAWSKVYAFDAKTGRELWHYDPKVPGQTGASACCDVVNRGPALWNDRLYIGTLDGRLVALEADTGEVVWIAQTTDNAYPYTITGAPRVVKGKVVIGNGGAEYGVRGYASAYDADTGELVWRFYTTPNPVGRPDSAASDQVFAEKANATWSAGAWRDTGGGGTVYDAITYDEINDLLLLGVGNGSPWNHVVRSGGRGDNLFLASIVALKPDTGEYVWHYQTAPGESWDYTATQHIMIANLPIGGQQRRVVMQAPKNGFFYVLDARTGKLLSADNFVPVDWAERVDLTTGRPVETAKARYLSGPVKLLPGSRGAHNWQPMAYSPKTRLVYIPGLTMPGSYSQPEDPTTFRFIRGARNYGLGERLDRAPNFVPPTGPRPGTSGELIAWDPVAKVARWRVRHEWSHNSGLLATAGDLVFQSSGGRFMAFDAMSGEMMWSYETVANAIGSPIAYAIDGEQYIATMVGNGGPGAIAGDAPGGRRKGRLLVFKLRGVAREAPYPKEVMPGPLDLTHAVASQSDVGAGMKEYVQFCQPCHRNTNFLPNLSRSPAILNPDGFKSIVLDGALVSNGMPSFSRFLDERRVEALRAYFLSEAQKQGTREEPQVQEDGPDHHRPAKTGTITR